MRAMRAGNVQKLEWGKVVAVAVSNYLSLIEHTTTMGDSSSLPSRGFAAVA
jgi:hypothetical protein